MLLVVARISTAPGSREALLPAAERMVAATRNEDGCLSYELLEVVGTPDSFVMLESWRDRAALDAHMGAPAMAEFGAAAGSLITGLDLTVHDVSSSGPL